MVTRLGALVYLLLFSFVWGPASAQSSDSTRVERVVAALASPPGTLEEVVALLSEDFDAVARDQNFVSVAPGPVMVLNDDPMAWFGYVHFPWSEYGIDYTLRCMRIGPQTHALARDWRWIGAGRLVPPPDGTGIEGTILQAAWLLGNRAEWPVGANSRLKCKATAMAPRRSEAIAIRDAILGEYETRRNRVQDEWSEATSHGVVAISAENPIPATGPWFADVEVYMHQFYAAGPWLIEHSWVTYGFDPHLAMVTE